MSEQEGDQKELSLREQLSEAFDAATKEPDPISPAKEPNRDDQGKFAKSRSVSESATAEPPESRGSVQKSEPKSASPANTDVPPGGEHEPPAEKEIAPPRQWKAADREKFKSLPRDVQEIISAREEEAHRKITSQDEDRAYARSIKETLAPYKAMFNADGVDDVNATKQLVNFYYQLRTAPASQKAALLFQLGQQLGADFISLANSQRTGQPVVNPETAALRNELTQVRSQIAQREAAERQQQESFVQNEITRFASDPANVHFEEVKEDMASLLNAGRAQDLKQAYEMAIWANPSIRSTLLQGQQSPAAGNPVNDLRAKATQKLHAAGSVKGGPSSGTSAPSSKDRSLREELSAAWDAAISR